MKNNFIKKITSTFLFLLLVASIVSPISASAATGDIVDVASNASQFSTLVSAIKAADLVSTLQGTGPFTVLAPTNDAFAKIPADTLKNLLLPENKAVLTKVLTYHVISGRVDAAQIVTLTTAKSVEGSDIKIAVVDGKVKLNDSTTVISTDISATNGIIHGIDSVLIPSTVDLTKLVKAPAMVTVKTGATQSVLLYAFYSVMALGIVAFSILSFNKNNN
jgi:uncharacterized surface protein with fasciclin (FAS1) repeats